MNITEETNEYLQIIDRETLNSLPKAVFNGEIVVVNNRKQANAAVEYLSGTEVIGFDTETKPAFAKGVKHLPALLQLSAEKRVYLFQLGSTGIPKSLLDFLENKNIIKVGAAVHDDIKALVKLRKMRPDGFVDLQRIVSQYGIMEKSVQKVAAIVLGVRISKAQRLTNWEKPELTVSQQIYAAMDAWVCREIYVKLNDRFKIDV